MVSIQASSACGRVVECCIHHDSMSVKCRRTYTLLLYSKGVYRGLQYFLIFALKHRSWASMRRFTIYVLSKNKKNITIFHLKITILTAVNNRSILYDRVIEERRSLSSLHLMASIIISYTLIGEMAVRNLFNYPSHEKK